MNKILLSVLCFFFFIFHSHAAEITVGVIERPPFAYEENGEWKGLSVDLWKSISEKNDYTYRFQEFEEFSKMLDATSSGVVDASAANISITLEREEQMDFSYPIYDSGLGMMVKSTVVEQNTFTRVFCSPQVVIMLIVLISLMMLWIFFHFYKKHIISRYILIVLVMSFLGYISYINFLITFYDTQNLQNSSSLSSYKDISNENIGVTRGSTSQKFTQKNDISDTMIFSTLDELYIALEDGSIDIIIHDIPVLEYYIATHPNSGFEITGSTFQKEKYGITLPDKSLIKEEVNRAILEIRGSGEYEEIYSKYF